MLELINVSKSYGHTVALRPLDLVIEPQRCTVLIGPSGCGKSTLLRLMIGLAAPDSGEVRFDGAPLSPATLIGARRRMGYVIQEGGLFPHLSVRDNITLLARRVGWTRDRVDERLATLCELTRFPTAGLDRFPMQISGGQRQRVSLMRALMLEPEVLLLDEPLGALDPIIRSELQDDLRRIFQELGQTVVLVTHDMGEAAFFGDVIYLLRAGSVVQRGAFAEFVRSPADEFVTRFVNAQRSPMDSLERGAV